MTTLINIINTINIIVNGEPLTISKDVLEKSDFFNAVNSK